MQLRCRIHVTAILEILVHHFQSHFPCSVHLSCKNQKLRKFKKFRKFISPFLKTIILRNTCKLLVLKSHKDTISTSLKPMLLATLEPVSITCNWVLRSASKGSKENQDEEEVEDPCNCQFGLAYVAKILNTATICLKRGCRYSVCGKNVTGKSTLMCATTNGQVKGFPSLDEVRIFHVKHNIDGSGKSTSVCNLSLKTSTFKWRWNLPLPMPCSSRLISYYSINQPITWTLSTLPGWKATSPAIALWSLSWLFLPQQHSL